MIDSQFGFEVSFIKKSFIEYAIMIITVTKKIQFKSFYRYYLLLTDCKHVLPIVPFDMQDQCIYTIYYCQIKNSYTVYTFLWSSYFVSKISSKCNKNRESSRYGNNVLYIFIKFFDVATKRRGKVLQVPNLRIFMAEIFCPSHVGYSAANM